MPQIADVLAADNFQVSNLTAAINAMDHKPGRIGELGLFSEDGINTTTAQIEKKGATLKLVAAKTRGTQGQGLNPEGRTLKPFNTTHLPVYDELLADDVQNLRAFGTADELQGVQDEINSRQERMKDDIDVTLEYHRIGAIQGKVLDADGLTVISDLFTEFGLTKQTHVMALGAATTKVRSKVLAAKRKAEKVLGGARIQGFRVLCSASFFDAFVDHDNVNKAYEIFQGNEMLRNDPRAGFKFGEAIWEEYRGSVGGIDFIPDGKAFLVPEGVRDLFITRFAPANYMETVNTKGLPYYTKLHPMDFDKGVKIETQSNPLNLCTVPSSVIELSIA